MNQDQLNEARARARRLAQATGWTLEEAARSMVEMHIITEEEAARIVEGAD